MTKIKEENLRLNIIINDGESKTKLSNLEKQAKLNSMTLSQLQKNLKTTQIALSKAVPGTQNWKNLQAEVNRTKERLKELRGGAEKTKSALASMAGKYIGIGAAVAGLAKGIKSAVSNIADFEQANVNLSTIIGVTTQQMGTLMEDALELGRRTQYTASQVTGLQTELAKLGFTQAQIHNMTAPTLNFATAVGTDLSSAASLAGATLRIFGLDAKDTEDALGVLAVSTNKSALDFAYLQTAMATVGPVANSFGLSLRDTTALLGTLANAGYDASSAATATRNILLNLADSSGKLATALGKPAKTFPELMEGLRTLTERGINLNEALAITDKRSVAAFSSFLSGADSAAQLRDALEDVDGELNRIAEERMNTVQGAVKALQSAWEGFTLAFSSSKGPIKDFLQWMANTLNKITDTLTAASGRQKAHAAEWVDYLFSHEATEEDVRKKIDDYVARKEDELRALTSRLAYATGREKRELKKQVKEAQERLDFAGAAQLVYLERQAAGSAASQATPSTSTPTSSGAGIDTNKNRGRWSLQSDESFLTAKAALTKQFNDGEIQSKTEYEERLYQLEISSLNARLALGKEKGEDRARIEADIQSKIMAHDEAAKKGAEKLERSLLTDKIAAAREAEQQRYEEDLRSFEKNKSALEDQAKTKEAIEEMHLQRLMQIDIEAANSRLDVQESAHQTELENIRNANMQKIASMRQGSFEQKEALRAMHMEMAAAELSYLRQYLEQLEQLFAKQEAAGDTDANIQKTRQAIAEVKTAIIETESALKNGTGNAAFAGTGNGSLFGVTEGQWQAFFSHLSEGKLRAEDLGSAITAIGDMAQSGLEIASLAIAKTNAEEQKEFKAYQKMNESKRKDLQKRLSSNLITQAQYDRAIEQMQQEEDAREEEMQRAQAERQKKMSISQAIIQSALAVAKTFAEWGWPAGIVPAAIMTGLGAAQVALISSTPVGFAEGGLVTRAQDGKRFPARLSPSRRGYVSSPTILVGEEGGEYVIPSDGLANPTLAPFIGTIEAARRAGTLRGIDFGAISPATYSISSAMAAGGPTAPIGIPNADYSEILDAMRELGRKMETVRAIVPLLGKGGIAEALDEYDKIKKRGAL